ncbi:MAG TPA: dihydroorotate dehydrogenase 2 [Stellaceae bacterium]|nr:dihydroorotate dehydrogenase 2 [Stellaceae bacterium]
MDNSAPKLGQDFSRSGIGAAPSLDGRPPSRPTARDTPTAGAPIYERVLRPLLFRLEPEAAHRLGQFALSRSFPWSLLRPRGNDRLKVSVNGWELASPIGLAAGFDKNGDAVPGLQHLGFGYLTIGSILTDPSAGHPRPRLIRYPETEAMVNCYGLPSDGLDACAAKLSALSARRRRLPLIANIHAESVADYSRCVAALAPHADGIELALRCPNRSGHIEVYPVEDLDDLLGTLRRQLPNKALFVKLPPYANDEEKQNRLALVERAIHFGLTGVTIPGNWNVEEKRLSRGRGSLSGRPTFANNLKIVREIAAVAKGRIAIKASGGVHTGGDAFQLLQAGASMIDIFTALVYRGWNVAAKIEAELLGRMDETGVATVAELIAGGGR